MKKLVLFIAMACWMSSAMAQSFDIPNFSDLMNSAAFRAHLNNTEAKGITHRVDSLVLLNGAARVIPVYDQQYKCVRDSVFLAYTFIYSLDYTYNNLNQLIIIQGSELSDLKEEMSYNAQGLVSEVLSYDNDNGNWILSKKTTIGYDTNGHPAVEITYDRTDSGEWEYDEKKEYTFNNDQLIVMIESSWNSSNNRWTETDKTEYTYEAGLCVQKLLFERAGDNSWKTEERYELLHDNGNLTQIRMYEYDDFNDETLESITNLRYKTNLPASAVAHSEYFGYNLFEDEVNKVHQALLSVEEYSVDEDFTRTNTFYIKDMTNVDEQVGYTLQLWPNPVQETLSLGAQEFRQVSIYTLDGKEVMVVKDRFDAIQVSQLANGCYLLKATLADGRIATQKFVKQ